jgi:Flp pilus assembly protein TadG
VEVVKARVAKAVADDRGASLVEFTLVLPVLALLFFGMLDFGKAFNYWNDTTHLSNEGARWAAVNKAFSGTTLQDYIASQADTAELRDGGTGSVASGVQVCVDFPDGTSDVGDPVEVKVRSSYHLMSFLGSEIDVLDIPLEAKATMRIEQSPTNYSANPC